MHQMNFRGPPLGCRKIGVRLPTPLVSMSLIREMADACFLVMLQKLDALDLGGVDLINTSVDSEPSVRPSSLGCSTMRPIRATEFECS